MDPKIKNLKSTTICGRRFTRQQLVDIQTTVKNFPKLSRCELAQTICEHLNWITPRGTNRLHTCLNVLEQLDAESIIVLPPKKEQKKRTQKALGRTEQTNEEKLIECSLDELMPIKLQVITESEQKRQWNEYVDRYHYLGYRRPIGSHLRYYIIDRNNRRLGCLLFSFATWSLSCRDQWIGWTDKQREAHLNLVVNNNRFLLFPWVKVAHLASKTLSLAQLQIADDWEKHHGYRPALLETFVDPTHYKGTCYRASNWQCIGQTSTDSKQKTKKDVYIYPLHAQVHEALCNPQKSPSKKVQPFKTAYLPEASNISLWQKIINIVSVVADEFDQKWQQRKRVLSTLLIVLFIFRLVFSKNKQGYGATISELWDYCHKMNIQLPQEKPVAASAFCNARAKLDEEIFKTLNREIIRIYTKDTEEHLWKQHRLFAIDGTKMNLPRPLFENSSYKLPSDRAYYPQGLVSCLYELKSKIPVDFELSSLMDERKMAQSHLHILQTDDVVVYDRGYFSYWMLYLHYKKQIHAIFRLPKGSFKIIDEFISSADLDRTVSIIPDAKRQYKIKKQHPEIDIIPLTLRLIKYTISNETYIIGTTLTDSHYTIEDFSQVYFSRWGIEELYKISKLLIDVEDFHAQTARGVRQELFAHFILITLSRIFANQTNDVLMLNHPTKDSAQVKTNFKNTLITVARNLEALFLRQTAFIKETVINIFKSISFCRQKERTNRSYERKSHKPRKKWELSRRKRAAQKATLAVCSTLE
jgi:hypothetical protein